jgi:hypothetical protein
MLCCVEAFAGGTKPLERTERHGLQGVEQTQGVVALSLRAKPRPTQDHDGGLARGESGAVAIV